jgi:hypothetical protein
MPSTRIAHINFLRATSPLSRPIADSTHELAEIAFLIARIELASGVTGDGYLLAFHYSPGGIAGGCTTSRPWFWIAKSMLPAN